MFFVGVTSINLMAIISIERLVIIYKPGLVRNGSVKTRIYIVLACGIWALILGSMPLLGWSRYSLEVSRTSCAPEWAERSLNVTSFNVTLFVLVFLVPLTVILCCSARIIICVNQFYRRQKKKPSLKEHDE